MKPSKKTANAGFTLVELLVVIVIIATLAAISTGVMFKFRRAADKSVAMTNLRQLQAANVSYAADNNGQYVPSIVQEVDDSSGTPTQVATTWFENPELISHLKGDDATYNTTSGEVDVTVDETFLDPTVVKERADGFDSLGSSFAYTVDRSADAPRQSQLADAARSAAFITADSGFTSAGNSNIAYRHDDKAIVVFYDGHAVELTEAALGNKNSTDIFWDITAQ